MSLLGFGFGPGPSVSPVPGLASVAGGGGPPLLEPSLAYDGTAGSGFTAAPTDPTRTTAKPAARPIIPPNQAFTDELLFGVMAAANDNGSILNNFGIAYVDFYYENDIPVRVTSWTFKTFDDANGNPVTYPSWWATARHNGINGRSRLYAKVVARDGTMQERVLGPYLFLPAPTQYDYDIMVAPSQPEVADTSYQNLFDAFEAARLAGSHHPRIRIVEPGNYWAEGTFNYTHNPDGFVTIEADVPVTLIKPAKEIDKNQLRWRVNGMHIRGSNITIDMANTVDIWQENGRTTQHWFDGITITNSDGRDALWFKRPRELRAILVRAGAYLTECTVEKLHRAGSWFDIVRGCTFGETWGDLVGSAELVIGCTTHDHDASAYRTPIDALTVNYTGAGTSATLELSGGSGATSRIFTAKVDDVAVGTFTVGNEVADQQAGTNYNVSNVVDWINGLTDWSATLLDDTRVATSIQAEAAAGAWGPIEVKGGRTFVTWFDIHADWAQSAGVNRIICFNKSTGLVGCQNIHLTDYVSEDIMVFCNTFDNNVGALSGSNLGNTQSHVCLFHNTMTTQTLRSKSGQVPDTYCAVVGNSLAGFSWEGSVKANLTVADNHFHSVDPGNTDGTTTGGDQDSLYVDAVNGDFTPAGALLGNLKPRAVAHDLDYNPRASNDAAGAVRIAA